MILLWQQGKWHQFRAWFRKMRGRFRRWRYYRHQQLSAWWRELWHPLWLWLFRLSGRKVYMEDRLDTFDEDWWRIVRHRMGQLEHTDLGSAFIEFLFVDPRSVPGNENARENRLADRDRRLER